MNLLDGQLLRLGNVIGSQRRAADERSMPRITEPATDANLSVALKYGLEDYLEIKYLYFDINE